MAPKSSLKIGTTAYFPFIVRVSLGGRCMLFPVIMPSYLLAQIFND